MAYNNNDNQDDQNTLTDDKQTPTESNLTNEEKTLSLREQVLASYANSQVPEGPEKPIRPEPVTHNQPQTLEPDGVPPRPAASNEAPQQPTPPYEEQSELPPFNEELQPVESVETSRVIQTQGEPVNSRQQESRRRKDRRQKESSLVTKIVIVVVLALVLMLSVLGFSFYRYFQAGLEPLDKTNDSLVQVEIPIGTSNKGIGAILEEEKIIKSGLVFNYFVKTNNLTDFKGGYYQMAPNMELKEIGVLLQAGGTEEPVALADAQITVVEGYSIDQIADLMAEKTKVSKKEFMAQIEDPEFFNGLVAKYPDLLASVKDAQDVRYRLEGYLFPATYNYYKDTNLADFITEMVAKTNSIIEPLLPEIKAKDLTVQQLLSLASLVEKEGVKEEDRRKIAQVFFNRLAVEMPLQSDISILYAMEEHKVHLSNKDTQIDSPYNLYINQGFGPGPFNSPSEQAINAVLNPLENNYLYFLADVTTGDVYFAETYEEHLALKEKYIDNLQ